MKNGNESWDVLGDSRKRYRGPWAEIGKYWPGIRNQLDCKIRYRALSQKKKIIYQIRKQHNLYERNHLVDKLLNNQM